MFIDDWKYVCSYYFNHNDATVACRQLGYSTYDYWYWNNVDADADSEDYLIRDLSCEGTEANLLDCNYTEATICYYKVLVICDPGMFCSLDFILNISIHNRRAFYYVTYYIIGLYRGNRL